MTNLFLARRFLLRRRAMACSLLSTSMLFGFVFAALVTVRESTESAIGDSVRSDLGGRGFTVQAVDPSTRSTVARAEGLLPLWDLPVALEAHDRQVLAEARVTSSAGLVPALLTRGDAPSRSGDAVLTGVLADALSVSVGDTVVVEDDTRTFPVRVTGLMTDPADRDAARAVLLQDGRDEEQASLWVTDDDPFASAELAPLLGQGRLKARTAELLAQDQEAAGSRLLVRELQRAPWLAGLLGLWLLTSLTASFVGNVRPVVRSLEAVGLPRRRAVGLMAGAGVAVQAIGVLVGMGLSVGLIAVFRDAVSAPLQQSWLAVSTSVPALVAAAILVPATAVLIVLGVLVLLQRGRLQDGIRGYRVAAWASFGVVAAAAVWMAAAGGLRDAAPLLGLVAAIGVALAAAAHSVRLDTRPTTRRVTAHLARKLIAVSVIAAVVVYATSWYSAWHTHAALSAEQLTRSVRAQPPGSMLVLGTSADVRVSVRELYRAEGGHDFAHLLLPVETDSTIRVTSPSMARCLRKPGTDLFNVPESCFPMGTQSPVNLVALQPAGGHESSPGAASGLRAEPALTEGGLTGILDITTPGGKVVTAETVAATGDATLGGNMPGAVLPEDGALARRLGLEPSGSELLVLEDWHTLSDQGQANVRAALTRLAPTAQSAEDLGYVDERGEAGMAMTVGLVGGLIVMLLIAAGGGAVVTAARPLRRSLRDLGASPQIARGVAARAVGGGLLAVVSAGVLARVSAGFAGRLDPQGYGWAWTVPALSATVVLLVVLREMARTPRDVSEAPVG